MASRWSRHAPEKTCYELREFLRKKRCVQSVAISLSGLMVSTKNPGKEHHQKCERIKLMKKTSKSS